jgi:hypothetical protein
MAGLMIKCPRARVTHCCAYARARRSRAARRIRAALWAAAPPIYFCGIVFALLDGGGGRGA